MVLGPESMVGVSAGHRHAPMKEASGVGTLAAPAFPARYLGFMVDNPVKSQLWDSFGKRPRSRLANPEKRGVLPVRRSDEG